MTVQQVRIKGSDTVWPAAAVRAVYEWLDDLLRDDVTGFMTVVDLACNGEPASAALTERAIAHGDLQSDGTLQTTRRDLTRLMVLNADDPMLIRLARWDELEVTEVE